MKLSVIICSFGRVKDSENCINSLARQKSKDFEIVLIDNKGEPGLESLVSNFVNILNIKYYREYRTGLAYARNFGAEKSKCEYLAYIDDDAVAPNNWVEQVLDVIEKHAPDIFGGRILPFYEVDKPYWFKDRYEIRTHGKEERLLREREFISGSNLIVKKKMIDLFGFDVSKGMKGKVIGAGEEVILQKKLREKGNSVYYYPDIIIHHAVKRKNVSLIYKLKRSYYFGKDMARDEAKKKNYTKILFDIIVTVLKILFRDRKKYTYWQQYVYEVISVQFYRLGACLG